MMRCSRCDCVLSRYTTGVLCAPCEEKERRESEAREESILPQRPRTIRSKPRIKGRGPGGKKFPGEWSRNHDHCISCGRTDRPHASRGRCDLCVTAGRRGKPVRSWGYGVVTDAATLRRLRATLASVEDEMRRLESVAQQLRASIAASESRSTLEVAS